MAMPPLPKPSQASEVAKAGTARRPSDSAAISLSATMVIHGAPNDSARITSNTVAMIQDDRVSTDGRPMRSCIIGPWLLRRREGDVVVTGVPPALDVLKQFAAAVRGDSERGRGGEHGLERRCHRRSSFGLFYLSDESIASPPAPRGRGAGDSPVQNAAQPRRDVQPRPETELANQGHAVDKPRIRLLTIL